MKKLLIVLALIALVSSCTVIDPQFTGKRIRVEPEETHGYSPHYSPYYGSYYDSYYSPYMWSGWYGWWSPYWLYGYYNYYGPYNPYFWSWYNYGYGRASVYISPGKRAITKRQLSKGTVRNVHRGRVIKGSSRTTRSSGTRGTISRSGSSRATSSRAGSSRSSGSRGSSSRIKK